MTEKQRQQAIKEGNLAEYYQKQIAQEIAPKKWKEGRVRILLKEKRQLLDKRYDLTVSISDIDLKVKELNSEIKKLQE